MSTSPDLKQIQKSRLFPSLLSAEAGCYILRIILHPIAPYWRPWIFIFVVRAKGLGHRFQGVRGLQKGWAEVFESYPTLSGRSRTWHHCPQQMPYNDWKIHHPALLIRVRGKSGCVLFPPMSWFWDMDNVPLHISTFRCFNVEKNTSLYTFWNMYDF